MHLPSLTELLYRSRDRLPVHLHVGAHKTGTTSIQDALAANREALAGRGVLYLPREEGRPHFHKALRGRHRSARRTIAAMRKGRAHAARLVLSEENLAGRLADMTERGTLYPCVGRRIARLHREVLHGAPIRVFFCIRSFDTFLPAVWSELIRQDRFRSFDEFLAAVDMERLSWAPVIRALADAVGEKNLVVWDFDRFVAAPARFAGLIAGVEAEILAMPAEASRPSVSAAAVEHLTGLRGRMTDEAIREHVHEAEERFPRPQYPRFAPFDGEATAALRARFAGDQAAIRAAFPGVRFAG